MTITNACGPTVVRVSLTDLAYDQQMIQLLGAVELALDQWLQDDVIDIDAQRNGSMLEMKFPQGSAMVINAQPPLQELWLACRAGGFHFAWAQSPAGPTWLDTKTGLSFAHVFHAELQAQSGLSLTVPNL